MSELPVDPDAGDRGRRVDLVLVLAGGSLGTLLRYGCERAWPPAPGGWPVSTLLINLGGAFLLGLLLEGLARGGPDTGGRRRLRLLLGTGFCGGFTTYSTLALETDQLADAGQVGTALAYPVLSLLAGVLVAAAGVGAARRVRGVPE